MTINESRLNRPESVSLACSLANNTYINAHMLDNSHFIDYFPLCEHPQNCAITVQNGAFTRMLE